MYAGFKFARRKYREHQAKKAAEAQGQHGAALSSAPSGEVVDDRKASSSPSTANITGDGTVTAEEQAEKHRKRIYRLKVVFGLALPFTLQALDTTIVAAALPTIAMEFSRNSPANFFLFSF